MSKVKRCESILIFLLFCILVCNFWLLLFLPTHRIYIDLTAMPSTPFPNSLAANDFVIYTDYPGLLLMRGAIKNIGCKHMEVFPICIRRILLPTKEKIH